jgi:hypothetical protein
VTLQKSTFSVLCAARKCTAHFSSPRQLWLSTHFWTWWKTGCYLNWIPITTITLQLDGVPPNFHTNLRVFFNRVLPQRWIGRVANGDNNLLPWPPRSPGLTPCNFFPSGFLKDTVYVPPLPTPYQELRDRITNALQAITADMLHRVWDEFDYRVEVCRVTQGAHTEGL